MTHLDLIIILTYLFLMVGVGLCKPNYTDQGLENFFLAGRTVSGWLHGISHVAATVSAAALAGNAQRRHCICAVGLPTMIFTCPPRQRTRVFSLRSCN